MTMKNREKQAPASLAERLREMPLTVANYKLMLIGLGIIILGFILMSGNGSDETQFDPSIFDARRIKVAPIVCLFGYLFMIFAIVFKPKDKQIENNETKEA